MIFRHGGADSGRDPTHEPVGTASLDVEPPPTCLVDRTGTDVAALARVQHHTTSGAVRLPRWAQAPVTDVALQTPRVGQQTEKHINDGKKADERLNHKSHPRLQEHARPAANNNDGSWQAGDNGARRSRWNSYNLFHDGSYSKRAEFTTGVKFYHDVRQIRILKNTLHALRTLRYHANRGRAVSFYSLPCLHPGIGHAPLSQPAPLTTAKFLATRWLWLTGRKAGAFADNYLLFIKDETSCTEAVIGAARNKHGICR